jgi:hypothetical protein
MEGMREALNEADNQMKHSFKRAPISSRGSSRKSRNRNVRSNKSESAESGYVNVGNPERSVTGMVGSYLLTRGARRGFSLSGIIQMAAGALLVRRAVTGHCELYERMSRSAA